jgi:site-specific recombinase XerD
MTQHAGERNLDEERFRRYCAKRNLKKETIQAHIELIKEFEAFLDERRGNKDLIDASSSDAKSFVADLMANGKNTIDNFTALIRYSLFSGKKETVSVLYGYLEGFGVPENSRRN